jgi:hypothetical protein
LPQEKKKQPKGRAWKRHLYNSRFVNVSPVALRTCSYSPLGRPEEEPIVSPSKTPSNVRACGSWQ